MRLSITEANFLGFKPKTKTEGRGNEKYRITEEQNEQLESFRALKNTGFKEVKRTTNGKGEIVSSVEKLTAKELIDIPEGHAIKRLSTNVSTGQQWVITEPIKSIEEEIKTFDIEAIVKKFIKPIELDKFNFDLSTDTFDRLVYTDVHVAMTTNENGHSLYGGVWNEDELKDRLSKMISHVIVNSSSDTLIIDELGDFMDGWDGETTRKGHRLPQNMDNEKAFDVGLWFKVALIDNLADYYENIICHNVCNDNHAGAFGYIVNSAFKTIVEQKYSNVKVTNLRKFITHYTIGNYAFILCHGKDDKSLKFGFKPQIDARQEAKIKDYIDEHKLHDYIIEFSKGDSHQKLFDESSSSSFNYYNYGALSPSSEWVQTNFKKGKSFFEMFNYSENQKVNCPYVFDWKVGREEDEIKY